MSCFIGSIDSGEAKEYEEDFTHKKSELPLENLHKNIFNKSQNNSKLKSQVSAEIHLNITKKASNLAKLINPMKSGGSVEISLDFEWGSKEGFEVSGHIKSEVHDDQGNYAKAEVGQKSDGSGSASVSAGHKEENENEKK